MTAGLPADHSAQRLRIHGHVQGVGYRMWVEREALALGLAGWVRNRHDSTVEALIVGPEAACADLISRAHDGPAAALVTAVIVEPAQGLAPLGRFEIKPTV